MVDTWEKLEDFVRYVRAHRQSSESTVLCPMGLWLFFFNPLFLRPPRKRGGGVLEKHTHTFKGVEKHLNCHEGSTSSAFTLPLLERIKTCSALLALFICKLARLGIWVTNCPGLENSQSFLQQKSLVFPDGGSDYWTGKGKKQAKHSCPLFTHICTSFVLEHKHMLNHTQKKITHWKRLCAYARYTVCDRVNLPRL